MLKLVQEAGGWYLEMKFEPAWNQERTRQLPTTKLLGTRNYSECRL